MTDQSEEIGPGDRPEQENSQWPREGQVPDGIEVTEVDPNLVGYQEIDRRFSPLNNNAYLEQLGEYFKEFANALDVDTEAGRYKSLMWTALEETFVWAQKALKHNDDDEKNGFTL